EEAGADRVADRQADLTGISRRADRRVAGGRDLLRKEQAAERAEFERAVKVDVLFALRVAIGEMRVHIDHPGHDEMPGMVDQPVGFRTAWRTGLGADIGQPALAVEDQHAAGLRLVLTPGEQAAAAHKSVHGGLLWAPKPELFDNTIAFPGRTHRRRGFQSGNVATTLDVPSPLSVTLTLVAPAS